MRIGLFVTCLTDTLFPDTGKAVVTVLERLGHRPPAPRQDCVSLYPRMGVQCHAIIETVLPVSGLSGPGGSATVPEPS